MQATSQALTLTEHAVTEIGADAIDEERGVIKHVKVLGKTSKNRRTYTTKAMEQAANLYDGIDVHIDHAKKPGDPRSLSDAVAVLGDVTIESGDVYANLYYLKMHPLSGALVERVKRFPKNVGLSHDAVGQGKRGKDGWVTVESVDHVNSVDLVLRPATNTGLFESENPIMASTLRQLHDAHKDDPRMKRLGKLLESTAELDAATVDVAADLSPADRVSAALATAAGTIVVDQTITDTEKLAKIAELVGVALPSAPAPQPAAATPATESVLADTVNALKALLDLRESCEAAGVMYGALTADQRKQLAAAPPETRTALVESWQKPRFKPAVGPKVVGGGAGGQESYDALRERAKRNQGRSVTRA